ncbi:MAG: hypothetical protein N2044_13095, partial [Cyclobacteriaceae bacterium]|nr:hypothetical protein [Cyclobacteriaceae bacterium]
FIDQKGNYVNFGEEGDMICTGFLNYNQPLIRYRIGDVGVPLSPLVNQYIQMPRVKEIVGRNDDIIMLKDGRRLGSFNRFFADLEGFKEIQVVQLDFDRFLLNVVPSDEFGSYNQEKLINSLTERLGEVKVEIRQLSHIPRSSNGKFKAVISHVGKSQLE